MNNLAILFLVFAVMAVLTHAAMTRVHGKRRVTLEAVLIGYDELVSELRYRCKQAEVIER